MSTYRGQELVGRAWSYGVWEGCSVDRRIADLEAEGDAIVTTQTNVMVPFCDGTELRGTRVIAVRFSRDEMRCYTNAERKAIVRDKADIYIRQALDF